MPARVNASALAPNTLTVRPASAAKEPSARPLHPSDAVAAAPRTSCARPVSARPIALAWPAAVRISPGSPSGI